jgi:hypothetical protein
MGVLQASRGLGEWIKALRLAACLLVLLGTARVCRAQSGPSTASDNIQLHGFVSQGFILTTENNYLARAQHGSAEFSEVGVNLTASLTDRATLGAQAFSGDLGPTGNYQIKADWYYLDYRLADELGFRAGRIKLPVGLYNEIQDVDVARVPVLLPHGVYAANRRQYLLAHTGAELYGYVSLGLAGALEYRLYGGTIYVDAPSQPPNTPLLVPEIRSPYIAGGRLLWETPIEGLRWAGSAQAAHLDLVAYSNPPPQPLGLWVWQPVLVGVLSLEYMHDDLQLAAEYRRGYVRARLAGIEGSIAEEGAYAMLNWRLTDWFQPGAHYSLFFPDTKHRSGRGQQQHDLATTLRFDVDAHWLFKLEGHYMVGTAGLAPELNDGRPVATLTRRWLAFFAKATMYF